MAVTKVQGSETVGGVVVNDVIVVKEQVAFVSANHAALTDSSGGTASNTLAAIGGSYSQSELRNSVASLAAKINAILAALKAHGLLASS